MTLAVLGLLALTITGFLILLDRKDARASVERGRVIDQFAAERAQHRRELQVLIQRIHAPEAAAIEHAANGEHAPPVVRTEWTEMTEFMETVGAEPPS